MTIDWLSAIQGGEPETPAEMRAMVAKADAVFGQAMRGGASAGQLDELNAGACTGLYRYLREAVGVRHDVLQRQFALALRNDEPPERCLALFQELSALGFDSPVHKARIVVGLLQYLERLLTPEELQPLAEAMIAELARCRTGCEENLAALDTFRKRSG